MENTMISKDTIRNQLAILILAFSDYESLELSLASHAKFSVDTGIPIFVLQNGRGTYDTERTCSVAMKYQQLFPEHIRVITHIPPQRPYFAIRKLLNGDLFSKYQCIIKLDDDVMVLTPDWIDKLVDCYVQSYAGTGGQLAYVTSLVNNNPYGFKKLIELNEDLAKEYFSDFSRPHLVGISADDSYHPYRLLPKDEIYGGGYGTIWQLPYLARWIHRKTTMDPNYYIKICRGYGIEEVDSRERYSINCMLFNKKLWEDINNRSGDDEHTLHMYCMVNDKKIFADLSVPMVHIAFYSQREQVRDMIPQIRDVYTDYLLQ